MHKNWEGDHRLCLKKGCYSVHTNCCWMKIKNQCCQIQEKLQVWFFFLNEISPYLNAGKTFNFKWPFAGQTKHICVLNKLPASSLLSLSLLEGVIPNPFSFVILNAKCLWMPMTRRSHCWERWILFLLRVSHLVQLSATQILQKQQWG